MARKRKSSGKKVASPKKVTVRLLDREHAGKVTTPYRLVDELVERHHKHLVDAKIAVAWRYGVKPNVDGDLRYASTKKGGDLDRSMHGFDFVIVLNFDLWNSSSFPEASMYALIDHELCKCMLARDANGESRFDEEGRNVYRTRKAHEFFPEVVKRHGAWTLSLQQIIQQAIEAEAQPLLKHPAADCPDPAPRNWRDVPLEEIGFGNVIESAMREAGLESLGAISDYSEANKGLNGIPAIGPGRAGSAAEILSEFWTKHPELVESPSNGEHDAGHVLPMGATG